MHNYKYVLIVFICKYVCMLISTRETNIISFSNLANKTVCLEKKIEIKYISLYL